MVNIEETLKKGVEEQKIPHGVVNATNADGQTSSFAHTKYTSINS